MQHAVLQDGTACKELPPTLLKLPSVHGQQGPGGDS